ncbi:hypothetical protein Angca_001843, partial [Angiostrongylus cantonensis]
KCLLDVHGLPKPWLAYFHLVKKRIFYHNRKTGESLWELPAEFQSICGASVGDLNEKFKTMCSSECGDLNDTDLMDCSEWDQAAGSVTPAPVTLCSPQTSTLDESEEMDVDFTENFRHIRNTSYDQDVIGSDLRSEQWFPKDETTRKCIVFDTCALIADPNIVHDCIGKVVEYIYGLRNDLRLAISNKRSIQCALKITFYHSATDAPTLFHMFKNLRVLDAISFIHVDIIVDSQDENWDTVFVTNDQLLSLKAHAGSIPCINVK